MIGKQSSDPRKDMDLDALEMANYRALPQVRMTSGYSPGLLLGFMGIGLLGVLTFSTLANGRMASRVAPLPGVTPPVQPRALPSNTALVPVRPSIVPPPAIPPGATKPPVAPFRPARPAVSPTYFPPPVAVPPMTIPGLASVTAVPQMMLARLQSPAVVIDLTKSAAATTPPSSTDAAATAAAAAQTAGANASSDDRFVARIGAEDNAPAKAKKLVNYTDIVPQGAVMSGVLETAINSDLPGYVRAVVSTDVTGFDGRKILIPRGSRLIGQYRSGLTSGEKRAFVIWQRVMRPDGATVQLTSPGTDTLGRAGLAGKVDTHFFQRFGSAVLLSVIDAGVAAATTGSGGTVVISSAGQARNVAGSVLEKDLQIPPTVKVAQGTPIRIFIARDLDFSGVGGVMVQ